MKAFVSCITNFIFVSVPLFNTSFFINTSSKDHWEIV